MKTLRTLTTALVFTALTASAAMADMTMTKGEIKEVKGGGEYTIKHGPLTNLDMGAMTMTFRMHDPKMGKGLKVGDKIMMHVEDKDGKLTIMHMDKAK